MAFCKECSQWRQTTYDPRNEQVGICQIDGKEKDDIRYACVFFSQKKAPVGTLNFGVKRD